MSRPASDPTALRRRFGVVEVLVIAAILAFGGFVLVNDGRQTFGKLVAGLEDVIRG